MSSFMIRLKTRNGRDKKKREQSAVRPVLLLSTERQSLTSKVDEASSSLPCEFKEGKAIKSIERSAHLRDCRITRRSVHEKKYVLLFNGGICELTSHTEVVNR